MEAATRTMRHWILNGVPKESAAWSPDAVLDVDSLNYRFNYPFILSLHYHCDEFTCFDEMEKAIQERVRQMLDSESTLHNLEGSSDIGQFCLAVNNYNQLLNEPIHAFAERVKREAKRSLKGMRKAFELFNAPPSGNAAAARLKQFAELESASRFAHARNLLGQYVFVTKNWDPQTQSRQDFVDRVKRELDEQFRREEEDLRGVPSSRKWKKVHFDWLVLYQVREMDYSEIARRISAKGTAGHQVVSNGVKTAAMLLFGENWKGWLRPASSGGRPRKNDVKAPRRS
jgi:hypothetical protein